MVARRQFIKVGVIGGAALATLGAWQAMRYGLFSPDNSLALDERHLALAAIVPAMLDGMLPQAAAAREAAIVQTIAAVDQAIAGMPPAVRAEIGELFALLNTTPTRAILAGMWSDWQATDAASVAAFLARWRNSVWPLLRSAYGALHDLIFSAWYGRPDSWPAIGYPGPPVLAQ